MLPSPAIISAFFLVLLTGVLLAGSFWSKEDGTGEFRHQAIAVITVTGLICTFIAIIATSKMWFPHLWKKNSTHKRHKQHTRHHPAVKQQEYRNNRNR